MAGRRPAPWRVRQAERDWLDVDAWLDGQGAEVTREAVARFVRGNEVEVQEVASPINESMGEQDFMQWRVPRGGDYREMLLALPVTAPDSNASTDPVIIAAKADFDRKWPNSDSVAFQASLSNADSADFVKIVTS